MLLVFAPGVQRADTQRSGCLRTRIRTQLDLECYVPADGTNGAAQRRAYSLHGDWWDSQLRVTLQANPKNKFAGTWDLPLKRAQHAVWTGAVERSLHQWAYRVRHDLLY